MGPPAGVSGGVFVSLVSFTVVFFVLMVIALLMSLLGRTVGGIARRTPGSTQQAVVSSGEATEEEVAVICGAVAAAMKGRQYRIARIAGYDVQTARWAMAGRQRLLRKG